ncbi:DUF4159 domain-containing protein [Gammaproteobacteria bacterium]|nr:DUF4159 domain-containing protein [Gammaproteobacteria bacterium]
MSIFLQNKSRWHKTFNGFIATVILAVSPLVINPTLAQQAADDAPVLDKSPEAEFHMARMIYSDGNGPGRRGRFGFRRGWWAIDYPSAEFHFTRGVRRLSRIDVAEDSQHLQITDAEIFDYPWLFVQQIGQGQWNPSNEEAALMREYLLRGGFLVVDDFHGEYDWQVLSAAMRRIFPNKSIVDLDTDDEVFHVLYDLNKTTQIPGERHLYRAGNGEIQAQLQGPQKWAGIYDDKGRLMVAINFNMDMGDAWEHADDAHYPEPMTALAYRFGINYVIYAMTH